jgi:branched-chain amino acid transport system ATP-binding protein
MIYEHFPILRERHRQQSGSMSGGEQQMLAMARALMTRPKLLLLMEVCDKHLPSSSPPIT